MTHAAQWITDVAAALDALAPAPEAARLTGEAGAGASRR